MNEAERAAGALRPSAIFDAFLREFTSRMRVPETELGVHYEKYHKGRAGTYTEWDAVMSTFFAWLGRAFGCLQEWEGTLWIWYRPGETTPCAAIQQSNWYAESGPTALPTLVRHPAPVRVLITYGYIGRSGFLESIVRDVTRVVASHAVAERAADPFLLIVGDERIDNPDIWKGFSWNPASGRFVPLPSGA